MRVKVTVVHGIWGDHRSDAPTRFECSTKDHAALTVKSQAEAIKLARVDRMISAGHRENLAVIESCAELLQLIISICSCMEMISCCTWLIVSVAAQDTCHSACSSLYV